MTVREWDAIFSSRPWGRWPSTRAVEWVMRTFGAAHPSQREHIRFLELGCGAGAQIRFLANEGFQAYGVDGSSTAIKQAKKNVNDMDGIRPYLFVSELMKFQPPTWVPDRETGLAMAAPGPAVLTSDAGMERLQFDCVMDVCTLQHLPEQEAAEMVQRAKRWLKPGGYLFSMHAAHRHERPDPRPSDVPAPRLLPFNAIPDVYRGFESLQVSEEIVTSFDGFESRHWIITGRKV